MIRTVLIVVVILLSSLGFSQGVEGVYQLELEDQAGKTVSRGTGFLVQAEGRPHILTSFHLLNARLLDAERLRFKAQDGFYRFPRIEAYDELNDVLVLSAEGVPDAAFSLSPSCHGNMNVAGFSDGTMTAVYIENDGSLLGKDASRLPVYLRKGFSGSPVMNENAEICGMVVLSSEMNASSVAVSSSVLRGAMASADASSVAMSVRELRLAMGVEKTVGTQEELDQALRETALQHQMIISIVPRKNESSFLVRNASNAVVEASRAVKKLIVHRSRNIMIRGMVLERLILNESEEITVSSCLFDRMNDAVLLKNSRQVLISSNTFRNLGNGIVIDSSYVDVNQLISDNNFDSVQSKFRTL